MIPSTTMIAPNHGMATLNFLGQSINITYQHPTNPNAPQTIRSQ